MGGSAEYRMAKKITSAKENGASQEEIDELERQRRFAKARRLYDKANNEGGSRETVNRRFNELLKENGLERITRFPNGDMIEREDNGPITKVNLPETDQQKIDAILQEYGVSEWFGPESPYELSPDAVRDILENEVNEGVLVKPGNGVSQAEAEAINAGGSRQQVERRFRNIAPVRRQ